MVKKIILAAIMAVGIIPAASAQFNLSKAINSASKATQALTLSDDQVAAYAKESVNWMDTHNKVSDPDSEYTQRLNRLTEGLTSADGIPLNFKVYEVIDINAFACPDGSVRVFSSLMDIMDDDELLGVIGHEIGHVAKHHSKKQMRQELLTGALKDAVSSAGGKMAALTDSQLGSLGQALAGAKYSQKQEKEADDFGYEFLKSNGKNPLGMVSAFQKLQSLEGGDVQSSYISKMFSSHPDTAERIKRMTDRAKKDKLL
ncbi:MAG: M48 family metallopeptidase [Muribaculaceae bacterium]|nr:M48 family metallopeptidase [Bacteroides sp.]MBD5360946.1 M48 family metallopeptidase [Bacteroides sp.]MBD5373194.1 M48 family metallopeptidase [Bacteroides sp.]MDE6033508.1 M48 family metallopeptidase [Muribaculaceae bacterium]MDE6427856.1 M48 family metallopeptidase [Muribaculaceae bacterium]